MIKGAVHGMENSCLQELECIICAQSKMTQKPARGNLIEGKPEHTVHLDIIGPFRVKSVGGA